MSIVIRMICQMQSDRRIVSAMLLLNHFSQGVTYYQLLRGPTNALRRPLIIASASLSLLALIALVILQLYDSTTITCLSNSYWTAWILIFLHVMLSAVPLYCCIFWGTRLAQALFPNPPPDEYL